MDRRRRSEATRAVARAHSEPPTRILTEALGDILAHAVSQRTCHAVVSGECDRTMDAPPVAISPDGDPYVNGQAARYAAWSIVRGKTPREVGARILAARDVALRSLEPIDGAWLLGDTTPEQRALLFVQDEAAANAFVRALERGGP